jgi:hypothetical protein
VRVQRGVHRLVHDGTGERKGKGVGSCKVCVVSGRVGGGPCVCMCRGGGGEKEITLGSPTAKEDIMYLHPGGRVEIHEG